MKNDILISIVVPVYNESGNIRLFIDRINKITIDNHIFEVIFVNDGSTDASLIELKKNVTSRIKRAWFSDGSPRINYGRLQIGKTSSGSLIRTCANQDKKLLVISSLF